MTGLSMNEPVPEGSPEIFYIKSVIFTKPKPLSVVILFCAGGEKKTEPE